MTDGATLRIGVLCGQRAIQRWQAEAIAQLLLVPGVQPVVWIALHQEEMVFAPTRAGRKGKGILARIAQWIPQPTQYQALTLDNPERSLGAVRTLRRAGLRPGLDVSVVGIDDHPLAELCDLTTVRQRPAEQGELAGRLLLRMLEGEADQSSVTVPTELVVRGSTAPPRGAHPRSG